MLFVVHFVAGLLGALAIFALFFYLSPEKSTSAPFGLVFLAITCGVLAVNLSPWSTPVVLLLYAAASLHECLQDTARKN